MAELTKGIILEWASMTTGWFGVKQLDDEIDIKSTEGRNTRRVILFRLAKEGLLEKHPFKEGNYRFVNRELDRLSVDANPDDLLKLNWPIGVEDNTGFGLEYVNIYPGSIIIVAGVSNRGKTTFCLNFLVGNMDNYHCVYMTNEMSDEEFVGRMRYFDWVETKNESGGWKFDPLERYDNWQDVIRQFPDSIHIIDYLDPGENAYYIGVLIDQIKKHLGRGIALIAIQKSMHTGTKRDGTTYKVKSDYGTGGQYSEHRARLVLHIEPDELYIKKCKSWHTQNPNQKRYKFQIVHHGAKFHNIHEITDVYDE